MNTTQKIFSLVFFIILMMNQNVFGQKIGVGLGVMRNYSPSFLDNQLYSFSPGVSLTWELFDKNLNWEWGLSYVNDGFKEDEIAGSNIDSSFSYNHPGGYYNSSDFIISSRVILNSKKYFNNNSIPNFITGFSLHIINSEFVRLTSGVITLNHVRDENNERLYIDLGLEHKIIEVNGIEMTLRYVSLIPINSNEILHNQVKHLFAILFKY